MPDTFRTLAALQVLLADNVAGDIGAQDLRDFLVSAAFSGASVYKSAAQTDLAAGAAVKITFDTEEYDTDSYVDAANNRLIAPTASKYRITGMISLTGNEDTTDNLVRLYKNGAQFSLLYRLGDFSDLSPISDFITVFSVVLDLAANDYIEIFVTFAGISTADVTGTRTHHVFQIERVGF